MGDLVNGNIRKMQRASEETDETNNPIQLCRLGLLSESDIADQSITSNIPPPQKQLKCLVHEPLKQKDALPRGLQCQPGCAVF